MQEPRVSNAVRAEPGRLRRLVEAGIALTSELSLEALLQRLVDVETPRGTIELEVLAVRLERAAERKAA